MSRPASIFNRMIYVCLFFRRLQPLLLFSLLLACVGCWEEVRYVPSQDDSSKVNTPPQSEVHEVNLPADAELIKSDFPTTKPKKLEQSVVEEPMVEEVATQPDEPLASALDSQADLTSSTDTPAPPAELDWLDEQPEAGPTGLSASTASPRNAVAAWHTCSKWSLAAAYFSKGLEANRYGEPLEQAKYAAKLLEIELPTLPELPSLEKSDKVALQRLVVRYLLEEAGPALLDQLGENFPADHVALAELAIKTHALLLVYTPGNKDLEPLVLAISLAAENSGLPETVWRELVDLLEQRADFASIKQAVFDLHDQAADFLAGSTSE